MKITIKARPEFHLPLDAATVALLMQMSSLHYDARCKAASAVGGFIYGWRNSVEFSPELPVAATWNDLDTVLKICENRSFLGAEDQERVRDLTKALRHAHQRWNEVSPPWTAEADTEAPKQAATQPGDKAQQVLLEHVAVAEDGGKLRWLTARRPRDCELYAMPDGGRAPSKLYAAPQPPAEQGHKAQPVAVPAGWQRRLMYPAVAGASGEWEQCSAREAKDFDCRVPGFEYRQVYVFNPQPPAEQSLPAQLDVALSPDEFGMLARIVDAGMWELASKPHTKEDEQLWDRVCAKLQVPGYTSEGDQP